MFLLRNLVFGLLVFFLGCSSIRLPNWLASDRDGETLKVPIIVSIERRRGGQEEVSSFEPEESGSEFDRTPLSVEVVQAFFDEDELKIKIHLQSKIELNPSEILVGVSGLEEGEVVEEHLQRVSEVLSSDKLFQSHFNEMILKKPRLIECACWSQKPVPLSDPESCNI